MSSMHPSIYKRLLHPSKLASMNFTPIILLLILTLISRTLSYNVLLGLKWGEKCKIPGPYDFLKASEECEISKGLLCQVYLQRNLCGCMIRSSLSYDEMSGECRRKPGHHCPYLNTKEDPEAYINHQYNHKCHSTAECVIVGQLFPDMGISSKRKSKKNEQFAVCRCKPGFKESRDWLVCSPSTSLPLQNNTANLTDFLITLPTTFVRKNNSA